MPPPEKIRISRYAPDPGSYTDLIGRAADGTQYMAFALLVRGTSYAVLHTFDAEGNHLRTIAEKREDTEEAVEALLAGLADRTPGDVVVKPFSATFDGQVFGLVDDTDVDAGKTYPRLLLVPNDFLFTPPWDGSYDT